MWYLTQEILFSSGHKLIKRKQKKELNPFRIDIVFMYNSNFWSSFILNTEADKLME